MSQEIYFKDFIKLNRGFDLPNEKIEKGTFPIVASTSIKAYHKYYKVKAPGVITGRSGSLGIVQYTDVDFLPLNTTLYVKDFKGNNPKYVYYFLKTMHLENFNSGAGVPTLNQNHLHNQKIVFVSNKVLQQDIVSVLNAYDELIRINNQRIKLLEETACQLYKEWFVRMRFPDYRSTKFTKGIPEGWEVKKVADIAFINKRNINSKSNISEIEYIDISSVTTGRIEFTKKYSLSEAPGRAKRIVNHGDTLFSTVRPENKAYSFIVEPDENTIASTGFCVATPKRDIHSEFIYFAIASEAFVDEMTIKAKGSAYPQVSFDDVGKYKILLPVEKCITRFHKSVEPMFKQIKIVQQQNIQLRQIRDRLLPRLISGKLQVPMEAKGKVIPMTAKPELNIVADEKATYKKSNPYFKRRVLAAYIIDTLKDHSTFGHVKLMKLMFLCEYLVKIETASNYHRDAAGPYDNKMMRSIDIQLKKSNWFEAIKMQRENHTYYLYKPLAKCDEYKEWFEKYYANKKNLIDELIALFGTQKTQKVEMVATLYKAWLDLSKEQDYVSEDELVYEVLNNWHDSKKQIDESRWKKCIVWMNNKQWITT